MFIKNLASSLLIVSALALAPIKANAQTNVPLIPIAPCWNGQMISDITGKITQIVLQDDNRLFQITVETQRQFYLLADATQKVARVAGQLLGDQVTIGGVITFNQDGCTLIEMTDWNFSK